jgi:hypothetical protein
MFSAPPSTPITDLEARLASPEGPTLRESYRMQLATLAENARAHLRLGLTHAHYHACAALVDAAETAQAVLAEYPLPEPRPAPTHWDAQVATGNPPIPLIFKR